MVTIEPTLSLVPLGIAFCLPQQSSNQSASRASFIYIFIVSVFLKQRKRVVVWGYRRVWNKLSLHKFLHSVFVHVVSLSSNYSNGYATLEREPVQYFQSEERHFLFRLSNEQCRREREGEWRLPSETPLFRPSMDLPRERRRITPPLPSSRWWEGPARSLRQSLGKGKWMVFIFVVVLLRFTFLEFYKHVKMLIHNFIFSWDGYDYWK